MPVYAGAAMVLLLIVVAPLWLMMNTRSASNAPTAVSTNVGNSNSNSTANINTAVDPNLDVQFARLDGGSLSLKKDFPRRVVLLNVWATWSAPGRIEIPV